MISSVLDNFVFIKTKFPPAHDLTIFVVHIRVPSDNFFVVTQKFLSAHDSLVFVGTKT